MATDLKIDISNPNAITYVTDELGFTILGGIRMDGLDRLRVTIRIEVVNRKFEHYQNNPEIAALPVNHNLDLYNDVQVEKLIRKAAERLEVGTLQITKSIADITRQLELYRLQQIEQQQTAKEVKKKILKLGIHIGPPQITTPLQPHWEIPQRATILSTVEEQQDITGRIDTLMMR